MATIALIVDWCGPFASIEDVKTAAREFGEVLYLATGKIPYQRSMPLMQYVGISSDPERRLSHHHHKLPEISRDFGIWLGAISSHSIAGRRSQTHLVRHSRAVQLAEWAIAYFLALPLNRRKRANPPNEPVMVVNRWFKNDLETKRRNRGHNDWPDFIEYDPDYQSARLQWFGSPGKSKCFTAAGIKALAIV